MSRAFLLLAFNSVIAGCTSFGGTIRGDFSCRAPQGTCSPLAVNDATALAALTTETTPRAARARRVTGGAARTSERLLTIMLPAHVDEHNVLHDAATVHVVAEPSRWGDPLPTLATPPSAFSRSVAPSLREVIDGAPASSVEGSGFSPGRAPQSPSPSAAAVDAARSGHRIARPSLLPNVDASEADPPAVRPAIQPLLRSPLGNPVISSGSVRPDDAKPRR